jgi:hypothetical protein
MPVSLWIKRSIIVMSVLSLSSASAASFVEEVTLMPGSESVLKYPVLMGDFNNDDQADIAFIGQGWSGTGLNIRTKFSDGAGALTSTSQVLGDGAAVHDYDALVGDFNNDGSDDIVFVGQGWSGTGLNIRTKISQGNGTYSSASQVIGDGAAVHDYDALVGDFNFDGYDDIAFVGEDWSHSGLNVRIKLSNGDGTFSSGQWINTGYDSQLLQYPVKVGDVDSDGYDDLIFMGADLTGTVDYAGAVVMVARAQPIDYTFIVNDSAYYVDQIMLDGVSYAHWLNPGEYSYIDPAMLSGTTVDIGVRLTSGVGSYTPGTWMHYDIPVGSTIYQDYTAQMALTDRLGCARGSTFAINAVSQLQHGSLWISFLPDGTTQYSDGQRTSTGTYEDASVNRFGASREITVTYPSESDVITLREVSNELYIDIGSTTNVRFQYAGCL